MTQLNQEMQNKSNIIVIQIIFIFIKKTVYRKLDVFCDTYGLVFTVNDLIKTLFQVLQ